MSAIITAEMRTETPPLAKPGSWFIWTDFGGVLTPPIADSLAEFCRAHALDQAQLGKAMRTVAQKYGVQDPLEPLDRPLLTEAEWLVELNRELDGALALTTLADAWFNGRATNQAWVDALRELRSPTVRIGMLSNMVPAWDAHWRKMVDADELFEHVVLSFEVGSRKPESDFFAAAAQQAGVSASQCVLVDDLQQNCAGAIGAGWQAVHFQDAASAREELLKLLR